MAVAERRTGSGRRVAFRRMVAACCLLAAGLPLSSAMARERAAAVMPLPRTAATPYVSEMVRIPAGTFIMGVAPGDSTAWPFESPRHEVTVPAFDLAIHEVTVAQWQAYTAENPRAAPGCGDSPRHATGCIGWNDIQGYLDWLKARTGIDYRLPSEAEWEYAARAGVTTRYPWGDSAKPACRHANVYPCGEMVKRPIGQMPPNRFGLYDVIGNVWEWTQDCWNESYEGAPTDGSAWLTGDCQNRVMRGGSFDELPLNYRLSMRGRGRVVPRGDFQGLRLARSVP